MGSTGVCFSKSLNLGKDVPALLGATDTQTMDAASFAASIRIGGAHLLNNPSAGGMK